MQAMVLEVLIAFGLSWAALAGFMWSDRQRHAPKQQGIKKH